MSKYNTIGGIRLKRSGRVSKESLLNEIKIALDSLVDDFDLESFSGANLYFQMYNKSGERLALISSNGQIAQGMDIKNLQEEFSFEKIGCSVQPVNEIERVIREMENERRIEQEKQDAVDRANFRARVQKEEAEKKELNQFRKIICTEFGVERINQVASSVGRIISPRAIAKFIKESQIPDCGYVYRASLKDPKTGKISEIRIYDDKFHLISTSTPTIP